MFQFPQAPNYPKMNREFASQTQQAAMISTYIHNNIYRLVSATAWQPSRHVATEWLSDLSERFHFCKWEVLPEIPEFYKGIDVRIHFDQEPLRDTTHRTTQLGAELFMGANFCIEQADIWLT